MCRKVCSLLFLLTILVNIKGARILAFFPISSISHQVTFRPLTQELARRGHEVIVVTTDPAFPSGKTPANLTEIDVHEISYKIWHKYLQSAKPDEAISKVVRDIFAADRNILKVQLETEEVTNLIRDKSKTFDLLLLEACYRPTLALSHVFKAPVIQVSSFGSWVYNYESIGASVHPIIFPSNLSPKLYNLTLIEKVKQVYEYVITQYTHNSIEEEDNAMLRSVLGADVPNVRDLEKNIDMLFLNINPIWEDNRPVPTNVIYLGGLPQKPEKKLPDPEQGFPVPVMSARWYTQALFTKESLKTVINQILDDLKAYLDSSKNGVIYVSFGTNVLTSMLPPEKVQVMVKVFSELPYDVLWKWDSDELPGRTDNIKIAKWLPQSDLLRHPKVKLFITQGGLQSTDEAIVGGVPLIGIPMVFDQPYNTQKYVHHNIGTQFRIETMTEKQFKDDINTILKDDSYRKNVVRLRTLMYDQPQGSLERAMWWVDYVLRHGGAKHLRAPTANMSWTEYLELRLILALSLMTAAFAAALTLLTCYIKRLIKEKLSVNVKVKEN